MDIKIKPPRDSSKVHGTGEPGKLPGEKHEGMIDRAIDWIKGTFWGGPSQATEVEVGSQEKSLEDREWEEGDRSALAGAPKERTEELDLQEQHAQPGLVKKMYDAVASLLGKENIEFEKPVQELSEDEKVLQNSLLSEIKDPYTSLYQYVYNNSYNIVSNFCEYVEEKLNNEQPKSLEKLDSFQNIVIGDSKIKEDYSLILDNLEDVIYSKAYPEFNEADFNKDLFKQDPRLFMLKALVDNKEKTDLFWLIQEVGKNNEEFSEAFGKLKEATQNYYFELRKSKRDPQDTDYQDAIIRYAELEALEEAINECENDSEAIGPDAMKDRLNVEFQERFGEEFNQLESHLTEKGNQELQQVFIEVEKDLFKNDTEFQEARALLDNYTYQAGETFDFTKLYFNDAQFKKAYDVVNDRLQGVQALLDINNKKDLNGMTIGDVMDAFGITASTNQSIAGVTDFGKRLLPPALVLGAVCTSYAFAPVGAVGFAGQLVQGMFYLNVAKKVYAVVQKALVEGNVFYDYKAAAEDQKIRAQFTQHIFLEAPTAEQRERAVLHLLRHNLLFSEDIKSDNKLKEYLSELKIDEVDLELGKYVIKGEGKVDLEKLPSFSNYRETRLQFRRLMKDEFPPEGVLESLIEDLYDKGLIYKDDFQEKSRVWSDEEILKVLPQGVKVEDLPTLESQKAIRNPSLFLFKGGVQLSAQQKLGEVSKLHQKGVLFKEDIARLKEDKIATEDEIDKFMKDQGISLADLPSSETYYNKTNVSLKKQDDIKREPFLGIIKDITRSQEDKLLALKRMHLEGVCFLNDLALEGLEEATVSAFNEFISLTPAERKSKHDQAGTGDALLAKNESILKDRNASIDQKMASLLELEMEGLLSKEHKKMVDQPTFIRYNALYLNKPNLMTNKLQNVYDHYQVGVYDRYAKLSKLVYESVKEGIQQNPGKLAGAVIYTAGFGWLSIAGAALAGNVTGVWWRDEKAVDVVYGPLKEGKKLLELGSEVVAGTISDLSFALIPAKNIHDRIVKQLPSDHKIKEKSAFMVNKTIGTIRLAVLGASIGSTFGLGGMKMGAMIGGYFGYCATNGRISQIPVGGVPRALKFSTVGALVGALVPIVAVAIVGSLALAGLISASVAIGVSSFGLGLIVPLILFGIYAGWQIAGLTGRELEDKTDPVMDQLQTYEVLSLENAGVYFV